jgi:hypothetical protein
MPRPMQMDKPSEPLGVSFTLEQLQLVVTRAIATYGPATKIFGHGGLTGILINIHFPSGLAPHVVFTEMSASGADFYN